MGLRFINSRYQADCRILMANLLVYTLPVMKPFDPGLNIWQLTESETQVDSHKLNIDPLNVV